MNQYISQKELNEVIEVYDQEISNFNLSMDDVFKIVLKGFSDVFKRNFLIYIQNKGKPFEYRLFLEPIWEGLDHAFKKYDPSRKTKITTFIYLNVKWKLLDFWKARIQELNRWNRTVGFDDLSVFSREPEAREIISGWKRSKLICKLKEAVLKTKNQNLITVLFLTLDGKGIKEIAATMQTHRKSIHRWMDRIVQIGRSIIRKDRWWA